MNELHFKANECILISKPNVASFRIMGGICLPDGWDKILMVNVEDFLHYLLSMSYLTYSILDKEIFNFNFGTYLLYINMTFIFLFRDNYSLTCSFIK